MEQYPEEIEKMLPCGSSGFNKGEVIKNQLNIHNSKDKKSIPTNSLSKRNKKVGNSFNIKNNLSQKRLQQLE